MRRGSGPRRLETSRWIGRVRSREHDENLRDVDRIFDAAKHVVDVRLVNQRIVVASMETRGATATYDPQTERYAPRASQGVGMLRDQLVAGMKLDRARLRVVTEDVGGAFGAKTAAYAEYAALLVAAKQVGRPVHWMSTRSEAFVSDNQARDPVTDAELALDGEGKFLALRVRALANMGAFLSSHGAFIASSNFARCFPGMYHIPRIAVEVRCVFTNTVRLAPIAERDGRRRITRSSGWSTRRRDRPASTPSRCVVAI